MNHTWSWYTFAVWSFSSDIEGGPVCSSVVSQRIASLPKETAQKVHRHLGIFVKCIMRNGFLGLPSHIPTNSSTLLNVYLLSELVQEGQSNQQLDT